MLFILELLIAHQFVVQAQLGKVSNLDSLRAQEDTAFGSAGEVLGAVDAAVVLTCGLVEGHADPGSDAWDVGNFAYERDGAAAVVVRGEDAAAETLFDACRWFRSLV